MVIVSLLEDVKVALRVEHDATDSEIEDLITAAIFDIANKGISTAWLGTDPMDASFSINDVNEDALPAMAKRAVVTYVKANYGYDNDEAERLMRSYDSILCSLGNSRFNAVYETDEEVDAGALGLGNLSP